MYNIHDMRPDCKEILEISENRQISETERFRSKNVLYNWICIRMWQYVHDLWWSKSNQKAIERDTKAWKVVSHTSYHSNTGNEKKSDSVKEASTTGIPLIRICDKLLLCSNFNVTLTYLPFLDQIKHLSKSNKQGWLTTSVCPNTRPRLEYLNITWYLCIDLLLCVWYRS